MCCLRVSGVMLARVAMCCVSACINVLWCSVLQCVVLQHVAMCSVGACCSGLQCVVSVHVAMCCVGASYNVMSSIPLGADVVQRGGLGTVYIFWCGWDTRWRRCIGCLACIGHVLQKSPIINGSFAKNNLQLKASSGSLPPCRWLEIMIFFIDECLDVWQLRHVTHINESCHTYESVMSHISMSHVTHMNESCHTYQ